jgi:DNA-binding NtrC family response regulator
VCEERDRGCPLKCAHDYAEAAEILARSAALPDLVVLDLHFAVAEERLLPEDKSQLPSEPPARKRELEQLRRRQGLLILERLRQQYPTLPVVLLTTTDSELPQRPASDPLVYFCENEIVDSRTLAAEITRALALHHAVQEGPIFWGQGPAMAELRRVLTTLSRSPLPVLLQGATGTGKSFLAEHFIHPRSGAKGPLVVTDLSTVPAALLPGHLFGSRRGSYTGAVEDHKGVFEQAHGGTLFLDEIANLDLEMQRQLLLVIERGQVTRLGDVQPRPAVVKLVAATNQNLGELVQKGRFRSDLYMRLNPATRLWVPPLAERREDLPELVRFALLSALRSETLRPLLRSFLARFPTPEDFVEGNNAVLYCKPEARLARRDAFSVFLSRRSLARLSAHDWPGNHRELKMLAINALVFTLLAHLDSEPDSSSAKSAAPRAPAILALPEPLIEHLLSQPLADSAAPAAPLDGSAGLPAAAEAGARVMIELRPLPSFVQLSTAVERQYLRAVFASVDGDLERMAKQLLGPAGSARQVHLRLNQLGLRLRELRGARP